MLAISIYLDKMLDIYPLKMILSCLQRVIASPLPERQPTGTPTTRAKTRGQRMNKLGCARVKLHFLFGQSWLKGLILFDNFQAG